MGNRTAQKDAIKDTTSDSQVNSCLPYRWPLASLTLNSYFYSFLYQYITTLAINTGTPHLKQQTNQIRRAALGRPAIKLLRGGGVLYLALDSAFVHQTKQLQQKHHTTKQEKPLNQSKYSTSIYTSIYPKSRQRAKLAAMQVATMLANHKWMTSLHGGSSWTFLASLIPWYSVLTI